MSLTDKKPEDIEIDRLKSQLCSLIEGKKYLLVLDDVWNEDLNKWHELKTLLTGGNIGNKILITTRSSVVAEIAGMTYDLKELSEEMSWSLFKRVAFKPRQQHQQLYLNLEEVGKEIVKKCANIPLAITILGRLMYGKEESVWLSFKENELPKIPEGGDSIMAILKISYHHIPSPLKNCFAICALFPKDYVMDYEELIYLWMVNGFIIPSYEGQSLEEADTLSSRAGSCTYSRRMQLVYSSWSYNKLWKALGLLIRKYVEAADHLHSPPFFALSTLVSHNKAHYFTSFPHIRQAQTMAEAVMFNIIESLLKNLGSKAIEEVAAAWGFQDQLDKLKDTANTMKDVLSDAEQRQVVDKALRLWLERLRSVVYDADDLFDEFSTIVMRKELMTGSTLSIEPEVRRFFSRYNQAAFAYKMARQVKTIRGRLDDIAKDGDMFALGLLHGIDIGQPPSLGTRETYSYVAADDVIGRDEDREAIVEMLLDPNVEEKISVLSIVGMGGLGKTILAQLVFNDDKIKNHFESRFWVCVGDDVFDMKVVIAKILMSVMGEKPGDGIDELQSQLQWVIGGKKYLLVLDDLWNENRGKWLELKNLLMVGSMGSKILVTTRSRGVAKIVGTTSPYDLKGLPEEKSWSLFERMASEPGQQQLHPNLVKVGKEIVKKCANVPLAIRTLGGLLYGQEESMWLSFKENELSKIPEGGNIIMAILKISYHHLASPLKNCFAYCALFPKDYEIDKETLIYLWMAEGFIIPSYEGQSLEELQQVAADGEEYNNAKLAVSHAGGKQVKDQIGTYTYFPWTSMHRGLLEVLGS
ncbi:hypothetical protein Dimus_017135 [Dionaea muscipula]